MQIEQTFYSRLSTSRGGDSTDLVSCVYSVVRKLQTEATDAQKPGMLLGKIQSGKTRAFLGIIAHAFDNGFDIAIVLTKGTKTLSNQTMARFKKDFGEFIADDDVALFDIMQMPSKLTRTERDRKIIFVAKKQVQNLNRILKLFEETYPDLKNKKVLLVDDEADLASVRFVRNKDTEQTDQGKIAQQMDDLRRLVPDIAFLQVTATPYSLYLQPEEYHAPGSNFVFLPKRPAFTELLPIHGGYVGGKDYFGLWGEDDPRGYLFEEVSLEEQDTLRSIDGRSIREDRMFTNTRIPILRQSVVAFVTAVLIWRYQQKSVSKRPQKYAMVIHNDVKKEAHKFQFELVLKLTDAFKNDVAAGGAQLRQIFDHVYEDLSRSVAANGGKTPSADDCFNDVCEAFHGDDVVVEQVNSDNDVVALLNDESELRLRTPYNIFIGGNILDRGITIPNLISFYYGRNPKKMQADTVLQHSRMYGARDHEDLAVTRFYTSRGVYERLEVIEDFERALRHAFETGAHDRGVAFIQTDAQRRVVPCAPSKVLMSDVISIDAGGRLLPVGFKTRAMSYIKSHVQKIDDLVPASCKDSNKPVLVDVALAHSILQEIEKTMDVSGTGWDWKGIAAVIDYFAKMTAHGNHKDKIWLAGFTGRSLARRRESGRFSNAPDTKQQRDLAEQVARDIPILLLFRQEGRADQGWTDSPFWWPVLIAPQEATPCVYAREQA
jgi:hypothetical protein